MTTSHPEAAPPTFEAALAELQMIVHDLEEGNLGLETSLVRFEEGIRLLRNCYQILARAEQKIEILTGVDADGNPETAEFDAAATFEAGEKPAKKPGRRRTPAPKPEIETPESCSPPPEAEDTQRLF